MAKHRELRSVKDNNMKILILPNWYPSPKNPFIGNAMKEQAKAVSLYHEVTVLYHEDYDKHCKGFYQVVYDKEKDGIRTIIIQSKKLLGPIISYFISQWSIFDCFKKLLLRKGWKPNVVHAHFFLAGMPAVLIGKRQKIPIVISEHLSTLSRHRLTITSKLKARYVLKKADIILPVSQALMEGIKSYGINNKFDIVPNVVNNKIFYPATNNKDKSITKMLYVGRLRHIKGIQFLIEAVAELKKKREDFVLDIVGHGQQREFENLSKNLGLDKIITFHGPKTKEEVSDFMRNCDFLVQPSLYETFGVVYIEAMACGKPVIGTSAGGPKEFITKDRGVLVPPENVNTLVDAIDYMLDNYQNYSPSKISQYIKENFSYEAVGKKIDNIYRDVLKKK